jgi:polyribonucleotide nucleotidyltransferase
LVTIAFFAINYTYYTQIYTQMTHNLNVFKTTIDLGDGKTIEIETGKLAKQAHGAVVVKMGDTMLLATVVSNQDAKDGVDFMPLTVDYREKYASTGRFPGGFFKREARPSDDEILTMRLVDRALRPLFPEDYHSDTQVQIMLLSSDKKEMPDALACLAASAALAVSDIPFAGPVSEVRVARIDGKFMINPTMEELATADLEMIVAGTLDNIMMVEGEMQEVSEAEMLEAIKVAHAAIKVHCQKQTELANMVGKNVKREYNHEPKNEDLLARCKTMCYDKCYEIAKQASAKEERSAAFAQVKADFVASLSEEEAQNDFLIKKYFHDVQKYAIRDMMLKERSRLDGRKMDEIRPIWCEVGYLPGTHGSAIFTRGETQSLTTLTLGSKLDQQTIDGALVARSDSFMLHYNFPPFSTGEARPIRGISRREVGHGNLALRALKAMIPKAPENPYTVRLVSEILESNGSSSMATVCAGTLALMDGGVKMKKPVSGIAMGLISGDNNNFAVLSDILGDEDHLGDMDFKITGTADGITACQMDIKVDGLSYDVLSQALEQAKKGRLHILGEMMKTINKPNEDYKPHAPRIESFEIPSETIGAVIGPGGKVIQEIQRETGTVITLEEKEGKGHVSIASSDLDALKAAKKRVTDIVFPPTVEIDEIYEGKVKAVMPYGAFVEIIGGIDGLIHISELEWHKVNAVEDVLKEGDMVKFKVTGKDPKTKKYKLSRKVLLEKPASMETSTENA